MTYNERKLERDKKALRSVKGKIKRLSAIEYPSGNQKLKIMTFITIRTILKSRLNGKMFPDRVNQS